MSKLKRYPRKVEGIGKMVEPPEGESPTLPVPEAPVAPAADPTPAPQWTVTLQLNAQQTLVIVDALQSLTRDIICNREPGELAPVVGDLLKGLIPVARQAFAAAQAAVRQTTDQPREARV